MAKQQIDSTLLALLKDVDTPTVCNAIEVAQGRRGFANFTRGTMLSSAPEAGAVVGFACTAQIAAQAPPEVSPDVIRARRMDYFRLMASGPRPTVAVVEDIDAPDCVGAWWGEVHTAVHKGLGLVGALTNGVMRDLGDMEPGFPVIAGSIGPSHAFVHVKTLNTPVTIFGMQVMPGDLIHADRHGALVIPADLYTTLEAAIRKLLDTEQLIIGPARSGNFDMAALEKAWRIFEQSRT